LPLSTAYTAPLAALAALLMVAPTAERPRPEGWPARGIWPQQRQHCDDPQLSTTRSPREAAVMAGRGWTWTSQRCGRYQYQKCLSC